MGSNALNSHQKKQPGQHAASPWHMPFAAWKQIAIRAWRDAGQDNISLVAAGVAFYGFLALVPLLGAVVLSYGIVADPSTVVKNMQSITSVMPTDAAKLIGEQLMNVVKASGDKKGLGLLVALGLAFYGAMSGANAIITALNIAYEEKEERNIARVYLLALTITVSSVLVAILAVVAIAALGHLESLFPFAPGVLLVLGKLLSYVLLISAGAAGAATLYRHGPDRRKAKWVWLTPGSLGAALLWLLLTIGFGIYVARFGNYNATYGSLGAVVVLLTWLYLSSYVLLLGAELNSEFERQTTRDTTEGPPLPPGQRGAAVADQAASGTEDPKPAMAPAMAAATGKPATAAAASAVTPALALPLTTAAPAPTPVVRDPELPSPGADYAVARVAQRLGRLAGARKVAMAPAVLATAGLSLLRQRGKARAGVALLVGSGALAWLQRQSVDGMPDEEGAGADGGTRTHTA